MLYWNCFLNYYYFDFEGIEKFDLHLNLTLDKVLILNNLHIEN